MIRSILFIIVLILLSACGTLEVGVEPDTAHLEAAPTPSFEAMMPAESSTALADNAPLLQTPTPAPVSHGMLELIPYHHPELGYEIAIPNGAMIDEEISATNFGRFNSAGHLLLGVSVVVSADVLEREAASPEEFLQQLGDADTVIEVVADNGKLVGAGVIVEEEGRFGSTVCEKTTAQFMVFIVGEQAYSVFIQADAPYRCDVTLLPETAQIINSFRVLQEVPLK